MKDKMADIVAILAVVGLMSVGIIAHAVFERNPRNNGEADIQGEGKGPAEELKLPQERREDRTPMEELNLTPEQREKFMELSDPVEEEKANVMRIQMKTKMQALDEAIAKPGATLANVKGLITEVNKLRTQMISQRIERLFMIKKILTPEQLVKMMEINQRQMNRGAGPGERKNPGPDRN